MKDIKESSTSALYFDIHTQRYDKWDDIIFSIVNFQYLWSINPL